MYTKSGNLLELTAPFKANRYSLIPTLLLETNLALVTSELAVLWPKQSPSSD